MQIMHSPGPVFIREEEVGKLTITFRWTGVESLDNPCLGILSCTLWPECCGELLSISGGDLITGDDRPSYYVS
jgi:hypothetical protein